MIPEEGFFQPRVKPKHRCPMTKELQYVRKQIIPKLLKHPLALPFKYPVDAITEGIYPDYFMVVSHPMDLYTIKARLDHGWYWNLNHCVNDINLVWRNARLYNPPDHVLHEWAVTLKNFTYSLMKRLKTNQWKQEDRLNAHNLRECEKILESVLQDRNLSEPFKIMSKPAHPAAGCRVDPVDLDTIERNLKSGLYPNAEIFAADFRKLIGRIYRLCGEEDPLVEKAKNLSHKFEYEYAKRILTEEDDFSDNSDFLKDDVSEDLLQVMVKKAKTIEDQLAKLIQDDKKFISVEAPEPNSMTVHPELSPAYLHMSQQEFDTRRDLAKDLVVKIAALDSEKLKKVVSIVRADKSPYHVSEFTKASSHQDSHNTSTEISTDGHDTTMEDEDLDEEYLTLDFATMNYDTIQNLQEYVDSLQ